MPFVAHKPITIKFSTDDAECPNKPEMIIGHDYAFFETTSDNKIEFAGNVWTIPTRATWYSKCTVKENWVDEEGQRHIEICDNGESGGFFLGENKNQKLLPTKKQQKTVKLLQEALNYIGKFPF